MPSISDFVELRDEVAKLDWDKIRGHILFKDLISPQDALEKDAEWVFSHTFATSLLKSVINEVRAKLESKTSVGAFIFEGGLGTGKSHLLTFLYHFFENHTLARKWLTRQKLGTSFPFPKKPTLVVLPMLEYPLKPIWVPLFEQLGHPELIPSSPREAPSSETIRKGIEERSVVVLIDEIVSWYGPLPAELKDATRNFLHNLAEESERGSDFFLFVSILAGVASEQEYADAIKSRLERTTVVKEPLTKREDRVGIIFFRLFDDVDRKSVRRAIDLYLDAYQDLREQKGFDLDLNALREQMSQYYPFHPDLLNTLLERYASVATSQSTRGAIGLLAELLVKKQDAVSLLLPADLDPQDYYEWLSRVNADLTVRVLGDLEALEGEEGVATKRRVLSTALLYSLGQVKNLGALDAEMFTGTVRPDETSAFDVDAALKDLPTQAEHLHYDNGRWVIKLEENIEAMVYRRAGQHDLGKVREVVKDAIKSQLRGLPYPIYVRPPDDWSNTASLKVLVLLDRFSNGDFENLFEGRQYQNSVFVVMPKAPRDRALDDEGEMLARKAVAARALLEDKSRTDGKMRRELEKIESRCLNGLREKLGGEWECIRWIQEGNKVTRRPDFLQLTSKSISAKIDAYGGVDDLRADILRILRDRASRGLPYRELRDWFYKYRGYALLPEESRLREALEASEKDLAFFGSEGRSKYERVPIWHQDATIVLREFAPAPTVAEPQAPEGQMPLMGPAPVVETAPIASRETTALPLAPSAPEGTVEGMADVRNVAGIDHQVERDFGASDVFEQVRLLLEFRTTGPQASRELASALRQLADLLEQKGSRDLKVALEAKLAEQLSLAEVRGFLKGLDDLNTERARLDWRVRRGS